MPRGPRLDYPAALHHVIIRGIERRSIFLCNHDRRDFLERLSALLTESRAQLYAWALLPNHGHLLLRTGQIPLSRFMQRLLGGYVAAFNPRHRRCGHLFQNRFKNILVEEEPYFLELLRYIHLNPVRAVSVPVTIDSLDRYRWTGHAVLLGKRKLEAQDTDFVLCQFGRARTQARTAYRSFVLDGLRAGKGIDFDGGGLRRSAGGWQFVPDIRRGRERWTYDERILASSEFVHELLQTVQPEAPPRPTANPERTVAELCAILAPRFGVAPAEIASSSLRRDVLQARAALCHLAVRRHGLAPGAVARLLGISPQAVARALRRAQATVGQQQLDDTDLLAS